MSHIADYVLVIYLSHIVKFGANKKIYNNLQYHCTVLLISRVQTFILKIPHRFYRLSAYFLARF